MANRHLCRSIVMQTLFEWDFNGGLVNAEEVLERNIKEYASDSGGFSFMKDLLKNILAKKSDLDMIIEKAAPQWPIDQISTIDRNVLRIGLYELLFSDRKEVPAKVAINEAIEIAKKFGGEKSGKFVNGVLGAVYKEIGKPGFEEQGKKNKIKKDEEDIPEKDMEVENLAGAVVYCVTKEGKANLALVHDIFGYWTLSKGHIEEGENPEEAAIREAKEELGLDVSIEMKLGENEYISKHPQKKKFKKRVSYYLAEASYNELNPKETSGLDDARWFRLSDILSLKIYDDVLPIITKAANKLLDKNKNE